MSGVSSDHIAEIEPASVQIGLIARATIGVMQDKPRKLPRQERSRHLVDAILDATARLLVRNGYDKLNTNAVAVVAGVSIGSLYQYFPNKEALVTAVVQRQGARLHADILARFGATPPASLEDVVSRIIQCVLAAHRNESDLHVVIASEMPRLKVLDGRRATVSAIRSILGGMPSAIRDTIPPVELAGHVVGEIIHTLVHASIDAEPRSGIDAEQMEHETVKAVVGYLTLGNPLTAAG